MPCKSRGFPCLPSHTAHFRQKSKNEKYFIRITSLLAVAKIFTVSYINNYLVKLIAIFVAFTGKVHSNLATKKAIVVQ